jgi:hypothetical protein
VPGGFPEADVKVLVDGKPIQGPALLQEPDGVTYILIYPDHAGGRLVARCDDAADTKGFSGLAW